MLLTGFLAGWAQGAEVESKAQREARMAWWKEARFGLFIHWGLYSIPGGEWDGNKARHPFLGTEWLMAYRQIPVAKYHELASQFNPKQFDANAWVLMAKNAGMKYIIFTAKHHDGFALFDSEVSDFNVVDATPFKRDVVKELAEACQNHGLKLGLYYSQAQDWSHVGGADSTFMKRWDPTHDGSFGDYVDRIAVPQVKEVLSKYGPIAVIWWDTPQDMTPEIAAKFQSALSGQSAIIQNSRLIGSRPGDYQVFEGRVPASGVPGTPWEVCVMTNESWGFSKVHHEWASSTQVIRQLVQTASLNGNYLMNIGPDATGMFPPEAVHLLADVGEWMKANGEAIYGSSGFPTKRLWQQGRITQKTGRLFASIFLWPPDGKLIIPVRAKVKSVSLLTQPEKPLRFNADEKGIVVEVGSEMPDPRASVLVVEIDGKATEASVLSPRDGDGNGVFDLLAAYAVPVGADPSKPMVVIGKREGTSPPLTGEPAEGFKLGGFVTPRETVTWPIRVPKTAKYRVVAYAGLRKGMPNDSTLEVRTADQTLRQTLPVTGDSQTFQPLDLGTVIFQAPGEYEVVMSLDLKGAPSTGGQVWRIQLQPQTP